MSNCEQNHNQTQAEPPTSNLQSREIAVDQAIENVEMAMAHLKKGFEIKTSDQKYSDDEKIAKVREEIIKANEYISDAKKIERSEM
jgi:hypothetical protein